MTDAPDQRPTSGLMSDALSHMSNLIRGEISLARSEVDASLRTAAVGLGMLAAAMVFAVTALNVLSAAIIAALVKAGMTTGWAALLVGVVFALLAVILARQAASTMKPSGFIPDRTLRNLAQDVETLKDGLTNG